jgi:renalase
MKIAVVGAGIAGLTASRVLSKAGHEVVVFEKSKGLGGRMATRYAGEGLSQHLDHGVTVFKATSPDFSAFVDELAAAGLVQPWNDGFRFLTGGQLMEADPLISTPQFTSTKGMNAIGRHLARWSDVRLQSRVSGLTHFGDHRTRKRAWMINLQSSEVVEADAVILAVPAPQALGILNMTQDETDTLKLIRQIDSIHYQPTFSLICAFDPVHRPEWRAIDAEHPDIRFVSHESAKRAGDQGFTLTIHASHEFTSNHMESSHDRIRTLLLDALSGLLGGWIRQPDWYQVHLWKYAECFEPLGTPYLERDDRRAPLALTGDYLLGSSVEKSYLSGLAIGEAWAKAFSDSGRSAA